jgi:hypothetical protein
MTPPCITQKGKAVNLMLGRVGGAGDGGVEISFRLAKISA